MINLFTADYAEIIRIAEQHGCSSKSNDPGIVLDESCAYLLARGLAFEPKINAPKEILRLLKIKNAGRK